MASHDANSFNDSVTAHFDFDWHIPAWTMNYYDRYIAKNPYTTGKKKRLVALACLWLGSKLHSNGSNYLSERSMVWLTRNEFTAGEIVGMEAELLVELGWLVHPPTAQDFIYQYLELLEEHTVFHDYPASWQQVFEESIQCAMAIVHKGHRSLRNYRPSCQAVAILIYSMYQHNVGRYINVLSELHRYGVYVHPSHSQACMRELVDFLETEFTDIVLPPMVVEEKDLAGDTRIESPVAISTSRSRNIRSV